mmetsp:Transcript_30508/g.46764  ORF Transcript_30508/g.46764 Transcript_30508/m.46764 type:complete len:88 (+) Transcript_30508:477-740(+)
MDNLDEGATRNTAIEILTYCLKTFYRSAKKAGAPTGEIDLIRNEVLISTLRAFSGEQQNQCVPNQVAEDLLEQLVICSSASFISQSI